MCFYNMTGLLKKLATLLLFTERLGLSQVEEMAERIILHIQFIETTN